MTNEALRHIADHEKALARSLLLVLLRVAAADGEMTKDELTTFFAILKKPQADAGPLFNRARDVLISNRQALLLELDHIKVDFVGNMTGIRQLLETEYPDQADNFKLCTYRLAKTFAESSVDFFGFGPKINKAEHQALQTLATILGIPPV